MDGRWIEWNLLFLFMFLLVSKFVITLLRFAAVNFTIQQLLLDLSKVFSIHSDLIYLRSLLIFRLKTTIFLSSILCKQQSRRHPKEIFSCFVVYCFAIINSTPSTSVLSLSIYRAIILYVNYFGATDNK